MFVLSAPRPLRGVATKRLSDALTESTSSVACSNTGMATAFPVPLGSLKSLSRLQPEQDYRLFNP